MIASLIEMLELLEKNFLGDVMDKDYDFYFKILYSKKA